VGDRLPSFDVVTSEGLRVTTDSLVGRRSVVVLFHTGCPDCRKELPELDIVYRAHRQEADFRLICIAREELQADIQAFWDEKALAMPYSPQADRRVYSLFARSVIPRIYIASPDGIVRFMHDDQEMPNHEQLESELRKIKKT
jgi:peroxiredoxin